MPKRLKKAQRQQQRQGWPRLWPRSPAGSFGASFALGLVLAGGVTLVGRVAGGAPKDSAEQQARAEPHIRSGNEFLAAERYADAFREFTAAADLLRADPRPHHGLGCIYYELDRLELADGAFRDALECDPNYTQSKLKLCRVLYERGEHEESVRILKAVERLQPNDPAVWWLIARNELRDGNPQEAVVWFRRYVEKLPRNAYGMAYLGQALTETGDRNAAETHYRRALELDSKLILGWLWLGQLLVATERKAEGNAALAEFHRLREIDALIKRCERALLRGRDNIQALVRLSQGRASLGQYRKALVPLERAMELQPDNPELRRLHDKIRQRMQEEAPPGS